MTVVVKKEWLRHCANSERIRGRRSIDWSIIYHYGWLLLIAFIPVFFFIWQNVKMISSGYEIEKYKQKLSDLQAQNSLLMVEAASLEDLYVMEKRAAYELGMIKPVEGQIVYISLPKEKNRNEESQERRLESKE